MAGPVGCGPSHLHYHMVQPVVGRKCKFPANENGHIEKTITRGKYLLNSFMYKIRVHPTGLCDSCQVEEDVYHYLIECKAQEALRAALVRP